MFSEIRRRLRTEPNAFWSARTSASGRCASQPAVVSSDRSHSGSVVAAATRRLIASARSAAAEAEVVACARGAAAEAGIAAACSAASERRLAAFAKMLLRGRCNAHADVASVRSVRIIILCLL